VRASAAAALTELSIGYAESPLNSHGARVHGGPAAGERAPIRDGETPVGTGDLPRFVVFADDEEGFSELSSRYPDLLEAELRRPFVEGGIWLVRPDGYVSVATKRGDWNLIEAFLCRISGR
jgi:hypothetical protein